jgi:hypothetical protein
MSAEHVSSKKVEVSDHVLRKTRLDLTAICSQLSLQNVFCESDEKATKLCVFMGFLLARKDLFAFSCASRSSHSWSSPNVLRIARCGRSTVIIRCFMRDQM